MAVILGVVPVESAVETSTVVHDTRADVLEALRSKNIKAAARAYRSRTSHLARPLMEAVEGDHVLTLRLAWMFIAVGDDHRAAQLYEYLGRNDEAAILFARADQFQS